MQQPRIPKRSAIATITVSIFQLLSYLSPIIELAKLITNSLLLKYLTIQTQNTKYIQNLYLTHFIFTTLVFVSTLSTILLLYFLQYQYDFIAHGYLIFLIIFLIIEAIFVILVGIRHKLSFRVNRNVLVAQLIMTILPWIITFFLLLFGLTLALTRVDFGRVRDINPWNDYGRGRQYYFGFGAVGDGGRAHRAARRATGDIRNYDFIFDDF